MYRFDYNFIGELTVEARSAEEAELLMRLAFESVGAKGDIRAQLISTGKNRYKYKIDEFRFSIDGESFKEIDNRILKAVKTICTEYHYDPVIRQKEV